MMSSKSLERVSVSYRDGYHDGYYGRPARTPETGLFDVPINSPVRPFASFDYTSGYNAGANDKKWTDIRAKAA